MNRDRRTAPCQPAGDVEVSRQRRPYPWSAATALVLAATVLATRCGGGGSDSPNSPNAPSGALSQTARAYLDELFGIMQANSINRQRIDWTAFRASVVAAAGSAQSVADTVPAIQTALRMLGDGHSAYRSATGVTVSAATGPAAGRSDAWRPCPRTSAT